MSGLGATYPFEMRSPNMDAWVSDLVRDVDPAKFGTSLREDWETTQDLTFPLTALRALREAGIPGCSIDSHSGVLLVPATQPTRTTWKAFQIAADAMEYSKPCFTCFTKAFPPYPISEAESTAAINNCIAENSFIEDCGGAFR